MSSLATTSSSFAVSRPNPSIERTSQRPLRALWSTAHVERWAPEARSILRAAACSARAVVRFSKVVNIPLAGDAAHTSICAGCPSVGGQLTAGGTREVQAEELLASCGGRQTFEQSQRLALSMRHVGAGCPSFGGPRPVASARKKSKSGVFRISGVVQARLLAARLSARAGLQ